MQNFGTPSQVVLERVNEIEDKESVLKYMTKSEIEKQRSSLLVMAQRLFLAHN